MQLSANGDGEEQHNELRLMKKMQRLDDEMIEKLVDILGNQLEVAKIKIFKNLNVFVSPEEKDWLWDQERKLEKQQAKKDAASTLDILSSAATLVDEDEHEQKLKRLYVKTPQDVYTEEVHCMVKYWIEEFLLRLKSNISAAANFVENKKAEIQGSGVMDSTSSRKTNSNLQPETNYIKQLIAQDNDMLREKSQLRQTIMDKDTEISKYKTEITFLKAMLERRDNLLQEQRKEFYRELIFFKEALSKVDPKQIKALNLMEFEAPSALNATEEAKAADKKVKKSPLVEVQHDLRKLKTSLTDTEGKIKTILFKITNLQMQVHDKSQSRSQQEVSFFQSETKKIQQNVSQVLGSGKESDEVQKLKEEYKAMEQKIAKLENELEYMNKINQVQRILDDGGEDYNDDLLSFYSTFSEDDPFGVAPSSSSAGSGKLNIKKMVRSSSRETIFSDTSDRDSKKSPKGRRRPVSRKGKSAPDGLYDLDDADDPETGLGLAPSHRKKPRLVRMASVARFNNNDLDYHILKLRVQRLEKEKEELTAALSDNEVMSTLSRVSMLCEDLQGRLRNAFKTQTKLNVEIATLKDAKFKYMREAKKLFKKYKTMQDKGFGFTKEQINKVYQSLDPSVLQGAELPKELTEAQLKELLELFERMVKDIDTTADNAEYSDEEIDISAGKKKKNKTTPSKLKRIVTTKITLPNVLTKSTRPETAPALGTTGKEDTKTAEKNKLKKMKSKTFSNIKAMIKMRNASTANNTSTTSDTTTDNAKQTEKDPVNPVTPPVDNVKPLDEQDSNITDTIPTTIGSSTDNIQTSIDKVPDSDGEGESKQTLETTEKPDAVVNESVLSEEARKQIIQKLKEIDNNYDYLMDTEDLLNTFRNLQDNVKELVDIEELQKKDAASGDLKSTNTSDQSINKELQRAKANYLNKMKVVARMEQRAKAMYDRIRVRKQSIEHERKEQLERVLSVMRNLSKTHPKEVAYLQQQFVEQLEFDLQAIEDKFNQHISRVFKNADAQMADSYQKPGFVQFKRTNLVSPTNPGEDDDDEYEDEEEDEEGDSMMIVRSLRTPFANSSLLTDKRRSLSSSVGGRLNSSILSNLSISSIPTRSPSPTTLMQVPVKMGVIGKHYHGSEANTKRGSGKSKIDKLIAPDLAKTSRSQSSAIYYSENRSTTPSTVSRARTSTPQLLEEIYENSQVISTNIISPSPANSSSTSLLKPLIGNPSQLPPTKTKKKPNSRPNSRGSNRPGSSASTTPTPGGRATPSFPKGTLDFNSDKKLDKTYMPLSPYAPWTGKSTNTATTADDEVHKEAIRSSLGEL